MTPLGLQAVVLLAFFLIACICRMISGRKYHQNSSRVRDLKTAAIIPYWIPFLGHLFSLMLDPDRLLKVSSYTSPFDVYALRIVGLDFNIVYTPKLISSLFKQHISVLDSGGSNWFCMTRVFGADKRGKEAYLQSYKETHNCIKSSRLRGSVLSNSVLKIEEHLSTLISFASSIVDQSFWERSGFPTNISRIDTSDGGLEAVDVNLFSLIRNFVGYVSVSSLMGSEFMELYPSVLQDITDMNGGFKYLLLGLPRWVPIRSLTRAYMARFNLLNGIKSFHRSLNHVATGNEPDRPWRDMSDVSDLMKARSAVWQSHGVPPGVTAPCDLAFLSIMTVEAQSLVFWTLVHLWSTPGLVEKVRLETAAFAEASQPPQEFGLPEPPRLKLAAEELSRTCPLLKACFSECLRLYSTPMAIVSIKENFTLSDTHENLLQSMSRPSFLLEAEGLVAVPFTVHHYDSRFFPAPRDFRPQRFLSSAVDEKKSSLDVSALSFPGKEEFFCPAGICLEGEVLAFVAGILALWDIEPAGQEVWTLPVRKHSVGVALPSTDIRVRFRRRKLS